MSEMIVRLPSPNFDVRAGGAGPQYIVLHYTDMQTTESALQRLCDPETKVSAHYLVDEDGMIYQLVDEEKRAWHAGKSFWRGMDDINSFSVGIELSNPGHTCGYVPFPDNQIDALIWLVKDIASRNKMSLAKCLLAHSDIAPDRKKDPGELFPWQKLAAMGLGGWPAPGAGDYGNFSIKEIQGLLRKIGYDCDETGVDDDGTKAAITAFCRRYHPEQLDKDLSAETVARLRVLARIG